MACNPCNKTIVFILLLYNYVVKKIFSVAICIKSTINSLCFCIWNNYKNKTPKYDISLMHTTHGHLVRWWMWYKFKASSWNTGYDRTSLGFRNCKSFIFLSQGRDWEHMSWEPKIIEKTVNVRELIRLNNNFHLIFWMATW